MSEKNCFFVCSRGILNSCDFHSPSPKSSCKTDIKYLKDMSCGDDMFDGMSIYVCTDLLHFFVHETLPHIKNSFTLVTGDSDLSVPQEVLLPGDFFSLIQHPCLKQWFAQNIALDTSMRPSKLKMLPIGLDYHTIFSRPHHPWRKATEGSSPQDQEKILMSLRETMKPFHLRKIKLYVNFSRSNDRFGQRKECLEKIPGDLLAFHGDFLPRTDNWKCITDYSFVLSPFGNGMDCHRTWEALCLGAIPVIKGKHFADLFEDLPVLMVENWSDLNEDFLIQTVKQFKERKFNYKKLELSYWVEEISASV